MFYKVAGNTNLGNIKQLLLDKLWMSLVSVSLQLHFHPLINILPCFRCASALRWIMLFLTIII